MPKTFPPFYADFFVFFILLGIVQGLSLSYFFLRQKETANRYFGLALLVLSILVFDVWLGYSNLMFQILWLVDFSEAGNFIFAPALYLALRAYLGAKRELHPWLHFAPAGIYFLYSCVALYSLPIPYKYNSNLNAWHPELIPLLLDYSGMGWRFTLQQWLDESMIIQGAVYVGLSAWVLAQAFRRAELSFWATSNKRLSWSRGIVLISVVILVVLFLTKVYYDDDRGDHIIASFISLSMYLIMGTMLRRTALFEQLQPEKKSYNRSSLQDKDKAAIAQKLRLLMEEHKPYLQPGFSLQSLAKLLKVQPHHLTQTLNEDLGTSFFELTAQYRIAEAQALLRHPDTRDLTIEDIAERVGYLSKSAFNTAFKKQTGMTPTAWRSRLE
ncbi:MAG: helix-turn-helix transcriptional regulator [Haliscomenobacter sp.]|uniref:helix-turn-helix transcriptional regulator n=1 Tax=Haliscomenobacter sp. TaxID=2717303 RepID=UPI0029A0D9A3|nr:helix-turn-helix transcriptional regulator [Haliscomenobacter sp.]MDX2067963.1 helix-turn-helix transcriptional regulator [Haliscomenobacter sp.]